MFVGINGLLDPAEIHNESPPREGKEVDVVYDCEQRRFLGCSEAKGGNKTVGPRSTDHVTTEEEREPGVGSCGHSAYSLRQTYLPSAESLLYVPHATRHHVCLTVRKHLGVL